MMSIVRFFIQRSFIVNLLTFAVIAIGITVAVSMKRDLIPQFQWNRVQISVVLPGATPEEMERYVTFPVEEAIKGSPGVEKITSNTSVGYAKIVLHYEAGYDGIEEAPSYIEARVNTIQSRLPQGIRKISVERHEKNDAFLFYLGFRGLDAENIDHRIFFKNFSKSMSNVDGVINVYEGIQKRDVYVQFYQDKLDFHGLSVVDVRNALSRALNFAPIGQTQIGIKKYEVKIEKLANDVEDIKNLPLLSTIYGKTVLLSDVADVKYRNAESFESASFNGDTGAQMWVMKDLASDAIDLKPKAFKVIEEFREKAPAGVEIVDLADGPYFVQRQLQVLSSNGVVGAILVFLILMLFLNWKTAVMTSIGLPVAYAGALIVLFMMGIKIDLLSIIGMILVIGILVDDAIIVAEKYSDKLESGLPPEKAATEAVRELIVPVTGTVLTTLVAFAPLIFIESDMSVILFAVPIVVISALCMSYLESFFILPNHLAHFVKESKPGVINRWFSKVQRGYEFLLAKTLKLRYLAFVLVFGLMGLAGYIGATQLKHNFNLRVNSESVNVYAQLKKSNSLEETQRAIKDIEDYMMSLRTSEGHVENVVTWIGKIWMNGREMKGYEYAKVRAYLDRSYPYPSEIKFKMKREIEKQMKEMKTDAFEKLYVEIDRQDGDEDKKDMISVRITGAEDVDFRQIESAVTDAAKAKAPAVGEYSQDPERYQDSWVFLPNLEDLHQYGIDHQTLARKIRSYFTPDEVIETRLAGENVFVYTEFANKDDLTFDELQNLKVVSPQGISIPLSLLGQWKQSESLKKISHFNGQRNLTMDFKVSDESNKSVAKIEMAEALKSVQKIFPTYQVEVIDADEADAKAQMWAIKVAAICIGGVLLVISLILGSLTQPFIVGLPIPFGLIGILLALYFHNLPLGLMALIGLVGTIGVAVNASIVMVDQINRLSVGIKGRIPKEVLIKGASSRLRALVLTTLTTLGGVFPMAYSLGGESGFTQPLAFSMGWGLTFATILTLFLLPALLDIREDFLAFGRWIHKRLFKTAEVADLAFEHDWLEPGDTPAPTKDREAPNSEGSTIVTP